MRNPASFTLVFLLALLGTLVLGAGAANSQVFGSQADALREARYQWMQNKRNYPVPDDPRILRYVECIAYRIIDTLDEEFQALNWEFIVFESPAQNASANPLGGVAVYSGILEVADSPDALAAVIGHEIAHVTEGHSMERFRRARRNDWLALGAGAIIRMPDTVRQMARRSLLPFAREQETDADLVGLDYMARAGFDPRASIYLWKNMSAGDEDPDSEEFVSTHPSDNARIDSLVQNLTPALIAYNEAREAGLQPNCRLSN